MKPRATSGRLVGGGIDVACAVGRSGVSAVKREGDGASPRGAFRIIGGYYRPDRFTIRPRTVLPLRPLRPDSGWCDDPGDANYNRPVRRPYGASHEALWRADGLYDVVLIIDWNLSPRARGRGSAIFFHLGEPGERPTEGCVAIRRQDLRKVLGCLRPATTIVLG
jgi:L,D-peptidoglycan transpeptidase YkuD (ErfK/YbiS/YcfS/YnhG family)